MHGHVMAILKYMQALHILLAFQSDGTNKNVAAFLTISFKLSKRRDRIRAKQVYRMQ